MLESGFKEELANVYYSVILKRRKATDCGSIGGAARAEKLYKQFLILSYTHSKITSNRVRVQTNNQKLTFVYLFVVDLT